MFQILRPDSCSPTRVHIKIHTLPTLTISGACSSDVNTVHIQKFTFVNYDIEKQVKQAVKIFVSSTRVHYFYVMYEVSVR